MFGDLFRSLVAIVVIPLSLFGGFFLVGPVVLLNLADKMEMWQVILTVAGSYTFISAFFDKGLLWGVIGYSIWTIIISAIYASI